MRILTPIPFPHHLPSPPRPSPPRNDSAELALELHSPAQQLFRQLAERPHLMSQPKIFVARKLTSASYSFGSNKPSPR